MPPKKSAVAKRKKKSSHAVGKYFYESRFSELNQVLANLRTQEIEVCDRHKELLTEQTDLIRDEQDIISYLNRTIQGRSDEIADLQRNCAKVQEERVQEEQAFEAEKERVNQDYQRVEGNLLSDLKLTEGKIHTLEEFRLLRDELMQKYEDLEDDAEEQKVRHKREIYEVERKFIIGEDKLKKEMDAKLNWLIDKFQAVTDLRVAATTLRVLKENIALNNMIEVKLEEMRKLYEVHNKLEASDCKLQLLSQMTVFEANAMSAQSRGMRKEIIGLVNEYHLMQRNIRCASQLEPAILQSQARILEIGNTIMELSGKRRILEQHLHEMRCQREELQSRIRDELGRNEELQDMLQQVAIMLSFGDSVRSEMGEAEEEPEFAMYKIVAFLQQVRDWHRYPHFMELLESRSDVYMQGNIGLVPREVILKSMMPTIDEKAEQVDGSFDLLIGDDWVCAEGVEEEIESLPFAEAAGDEEEDVIMVEQKTQTDASQSSDTD